MNWTICTYLCFIFVPYKEFIKHLWWRSSVPWEINILSYNNTHIPLYYVIFMAIISLLSPQRLHNHNWTVHSPCKMLLFWQFCVSKSPPCLIWQPGAGSIIFCPGCCVTERHFSTASLLWGDRCHLHHSQISRCCHVWWAGVAGGRGVGSSWVGNVFQRLQRVRLRAGWDWAPAAAWR